MVVISYQFSLNFVNSRANQPSNLVGDVIDQLEFVSTGENSCDVKCHDRSTALFVAREMELPYKSIK